MVVTSKQLAALMHNLQCCIADSHHSILRHLQLFGTNSRFTGTQQPTDGNSDLMVLPMLPLGILLTKMSSKYTFIEEGFRLFGYGEKAVEWS